jgi:hypothetical protein
MRSLSSSGSDPSAIPSSSHPGRRRCPRSRAPGRFRSRRRRARIRPIPPPPGRAADSRRRCTFPPPRSRRRPLIRSAAHCMRPSSQT